MVRPDEVGGLSSLLNIRHVHSHSSSYVLMISESLASQDEKSRFISACARFRNENKYGLKRSNCRFICFCQSRETPV